MEFKIKSVSKLLIDISLQNQDLEKAYLPGSMVSYSDLFSYIYHIPQNKISTLSIFMQPSLIIKTTVRLLVCSPALKYLLYITVILNLWGGDRRTVV